MPFDNISITTGVIFTAGVFLAYITVVGYKQYNYLMFSSQNLTQPDLILHSILPSQPVMNKTMDMWHNHPFNPVNVLIYSFNGKYVDDPKLRKEITELILAVFAAYILIGVMSVLSYFMLWSFGNLNEA